jgi:hypothetical protein
VCERQDWPLGAENSSDLVCVDARIGPNVQKIVLT